VLRFEGEQLMIQDITEGWWFKPRVIEESRQH
jgi:hypothetical protein